MRAAKGAMTFAALGVAANSRRGGPGAGEAGGCPATLAALVSERRTRATSPRAWSKALGSEYGARRLGGRVGLGELEQGVRARSPLVVAVADGPAVAGRARLRSRDPCVRAPCRPRRGRRRTLTSSTRPPTGAAARTRSAPDAAVEQSAGFTAIAVSGFGFDPPHRSPSLHRRAGGAGGAQASPAGC